MTVKSAVKIPWHRNVSNQFVGGAKIQVPFSVLGKVMEKVTAPEQPPPPPAPSLDQVYPPGMQVYAASLTPERALAFEAGVDRFCKDAGFDASDVEAMQALLKQAGLVGAVKAVRGAIRPVLGNRLSRWIATKPVRAAQAMPGLAANIGGMMGADWAFNKLFGGSAPEQVAAEPGGGYTGPNAAFPMYRPVQQHGQAPLSVNTPIYHQASLQKEAIAIPGAALGAAAGKTLARGVPLLGAGLSGASAIQNALKGNWGRAALDVGSGLASFIPGVGTPIALALGAGSAGLDMSEAAKQPSAKQPIAKGRLQWPLMSGAGRAASPLPGMLRHASYKAAALDGLRRVSAGQLKQSGFWDVLGAPFSLGAAVANKTWDALHWGDPDYQKAKEVRREYGIKGPLVEYEKEMHPWDTAMNWFDAGPTKRDIAAYNREVGSNWSNVRLQEAEDRIQEAAKKYGVGSAEYQKSLKAFGGAQETSEKPLRITEDIAAARRGLYSSSPAMREHAARYTRSMLGPRGEPFLERAEAAQPGVATASQFSSPVRKSLGIAQPPVSATSPIPSTTGAAAPSVPGSTGAAAPSPVPGTLAKPRHVLLPHKG